MSAPTEPGVPPLAGRWRGIGCWRRWLGCMPAAAVVLKQLLAPQVAGEGFAAMAASFAGMLPIMVYFGLGLRLWHMQRVVRPANRAAWLKADLAAVVTDRDRLADTALALGLVVVFLAAFAQAKGLITAIQPFAWDRRWRRRTGRCTLAWPLARHCRQCWGIRWC
jgi:hypothetical protein